MPEPPVIESFVAAVSHRIRGLEGAQRHALIVAAKKARRAVEAGESPADEDWESWFPEPDVRAVAREVLAQVSVVDMDFAATALDAGRGPADPTRTQAASPEAVDKKWHALLASIPEDGLASNDGATVDGMELGRMILAVSRGKGAVAYDELPVAEGFRDRFIDAARDAGRLDAIRGLPGGES